MNVSRAHQAILGAAAGLSVVASAVGCVGVPAYVCHSNADCISKDGEQGICGDAVLFSGGESNQIWPRGPGPDKFCSFADPSCPSSGRRYAEGAGSLASTCLLTGPKCVAELALGTGFSCARRTDGAVYCWGDNTDGQIGDGTNMQRPSPTRVGLMGHATALTAAEHHVCALLDDSTVWCWGSNEVKQLGVVDPTVMSSSTPVEVMIGAGMPPTYAPFKAKAISAGGGHTCAVDLNGQLDCWGENQVGGHGGQCGQDPAKFDDVPFPTPIPSFNNAVAVGTGDEFACALKDDKSVWCWGDNQNGELGDGSKIDSFVPVQVASLSSVGQLISADEFGCALKNDSSVWCWGYGGSGAVGSAMADQAEPALITHAAGAFASGVSFHICVTQKGGDLFCWGANEAGQLGTGDTQTTLSKPTQVKLTTVETVALGDAHTCAVTQDGVLWCWGDNSKGQLGSGGPGGSASIPYRLPSFPCP